MNQFVLKKNHVFGDGMRFPKGTQTEPCTKKEIEALQKAFSNPRFAPIQGNIPVKLGGKMRWAEVEE
jgi:hypothetical protein